MGIDVTQHRGLVHWVIKRRGLDRRIARSPNLGVDDIEQAGMIGLLKAAERFDEARGYAFSTYATFWVRHVIERLIEDEACTVRTPVHLQQRRRKAGEPPRAQVHSLDAPVSGGRDDTESGSHVGMLAAPEPELAPDLPPLETLIARTPDLSDREIRVLRMRASDAELTLQQIGAELGISRERVRQIEAKAMLRIREQLARDGELEGVEVPRYVATQRSQSPQRRQHWSQAAARRRRERMQDPAYREAMNQRRRATRAERKAQQQPGRAAA